MDGGNMAETLSAFDTLCRVKCASQVIQVPPLYQTLIEAKDEDND